MYLKIVHDIYNNIFSTVITIDSLGTEELSEEEERELLKDFPSKVAYRNLTFVKNIRINGSVPEVTDAKADSDEIVTVKLPALSNKELLLNKDFEATYRIDVNKIANTSVDSNVLTTKELVAQAYCLIFDTVIQEAIESIMMDIRQKAPLFTGESIVSV